MSKISGSATEEKHKELELNKLSDIEILEVVGRLKNILNNKRVVSQLPDKGQQLSEKLKILEEQVKLRQTMKVMEASLKTLSLNDEQNDENTHVKHICSFEKPAKERYKPFLTLKCNSTNHTSVKFTKLISLEQSMDLLAQQSYKAKETQFDVQKSQDNEDNNSSSSSESEHDSS